MTDRELLELAAKAAGAKRTDYSDKTPDHWTIQHSDGVWRKWNPLTDDGDALRLEVDLNITNKIMLLEILAEENELCNGDYRKARRRAIARAAAEIGKAMK